jgi:hypothetical protein
MSRKPRATPRELVPGWPNKPASDVSAETARRFAVNLRAAIGDESVRSVAKKAGVNHSTLLGILEGRTWPDLETISKIERGVNHDLWPGRVR